MLEWTQAEIDRVNEAITQIKSRCPAEGAVLEEFRGRLAIHLWAKRDDSSMQDGPTYGRVDPPTGPVNSIGVWDGYNAEEDDGVNWTRTLAHEAGHVLEVGGPSVPESQITARADYCAGI